MNVVRTNKLIAFFVVYGLIVGFLTVWWWHYSDNLFFPNIPAILLGDRAYSLSIDLLGDPSSAQAHYTIPWILRIPQVYVLASTTFWGFLGIVAQSCLRLAKRRMSR